MDERKMIVGYDGSDGARDALALGRIIADLSPTAVRVVYGYPFIPRVPAGVPDVASVMREAAERLLEDAPPTFTDPDAVELLAVPTTSPPRVLHRMAAEWGAHMIVIGPTRRDGRLGRVAEQVLHGSPCPVLVASAGYVQRKHRLDTIAVAFNGSDESGPALREGARLARLANADLRLVDVVDVSHGYYPPDWSETVPEYRERLAHRAEQQVARAVAELGYPAVAETPFGDAVEQLIERTSGVDLLVMGSRDHGPLRRLVLGSVSTQVVRHAACPVMVLTRTPYGREIPPPHTTRGVAVA